MTGVGCGAILQLFRLARSLYPANHHNKSILKPSILVYLNTTNNNFDNN